MSRRNDSVKGPHFWNVLSQAGLTDINPEDLPSRIRATRSTVMQRIQELLEQRNQPVECESAASALGTLTELERKVRKKAKTPEP